MSRAWSVVVAATALLSLIDVGCASKVLSLDFKKEAGQRRDPATRLRKRASASLPQAPLANAELRYLTNITVGTPAQQVTVLLDTGSSDLWVLSNLKDVCQDPENGCSGGTFDYKSSSTFQDVGQNEFNISYQDGTQISGDYFVDTVNVGGVSLTNMTMGIATLAQSQHPIYNIMGIGYPSNEAILEVDPNGEYDNLVYMMKDQGVISTAAYSLWLNDLDANTGSILFGGIDSDKFSGDLSVMPVQPDASGQSDQLTSFTVALVSLGATASGQNSSFSSQDFPLPVVLDSGTSVTYLPSDLATQIYSGFGVTNDQTQGPIIACSAATADGALNFGFGSANGVVISVSLAELILPIPGGGSVTFPDGTPACEFGITAQDEPPWLFGDTFLRSAYVVYDLESNNIGLAQTVFNATTSNIQEIPSSNSTSGSGSNPNFVSVSSAAIVTQTATQNLHGIGVATGQATLSATGTNVVSNQQSATLHLGGATHASTATATNGATTPAAKSGATVASRPQSFGALSVAMGVLVVLSFMSG